jgi:multicomponent Na+:H+ antiporter subunit G
VSWTTVTDVVASICLLGGAFFSLAAAIGAVRFNDLLSRMHAATKPQVLGMLLILLGLALRLLEPAAVGLLFLTGMSQLLTAPVAAHMVSRAAYRLGQVDEDVIVATDVERGPENPEAG